MNELVAGIAGLGTAASSGYCALCIWASVRFASRRGRTSREATEFPPVSILKPLKGTDPEMYESLRSHCLQNYPQYEILLGVSDPSDPALAFAERLRREFPEHAIRLVRCEQKLGTNGKVSSLVQMAAVAKHQVFLVNDSDIRVGPGYLHTVMAELQKPNTGLVTCLYRGVPAGTIPSRLESLGINTDFMAGVLVAQLLEGGLRFGLGSTLALRRCDLQTIGGFEAMVDYLADDYELGQRLAERNFNIELSQAIVETFLPDYGFAGFFSHQLRWAKTIRASRPAGYAGLLLTFTLPWAVLCLALARGAAWAWELFGVALLMRMMMALVSGKLVLRDEEVVRSLWLLPVRDALATFIWMAGWAGRKIVWRGEIFSLEKRKLKRTG